MLCVITLFCRCEGLADEYNRHHPWNRFKTIGPVTDLPWLGYLITTMDSFSKITWKLTSRIWSLENPHWLRSNKEHSPWCRICNRVILLKHFSHRSIVLSDIVRLVYTIIGSHQWSITLVHAKWCSTTFLSMRHWWKLSW